MPALGSWELTDNNTLRVLVVDDERLAREELCYQLDQIEDLTVIGQAADGIEALAAVR